MSFYYYEGGLVWPPSSFTRNALEQAPPSTGLGALATADMAGKRPLCAMGPMMSALILSSFDFVEIIDSA